MNRKSIKFKDTNAAPGSQLHAALLECDYIKAEKIYHQCERERKALEGPVAIDPSLIGIGRRER